MAQGVKVLAAKPDDLNSVHGIYTVEGKKPLLQVVLWPPKVYSACLRMCVHVHPLLPQKILKRKGKNSKLTEGDGGMTLLMPQQENARYMWHH